MRSSRSRSPSPGRSVAPLQPKLGDPISEMALPALDLKYTPSKEVAEAKNLFATLTSKELTQHKKMVYSVAWNNLGEKLAAGSVDQTASVWNVDARGPKSECTLRGHTDSVDQLIWNPQHTTMLATASADKSCRVWDIRAKKCLQKIETKGQNINITWSPDGKFIAVGNKRDIISVIDTKTYKIMSNHKFSFEVNEIAWDKSGNYILFATGNGTLEILRFPTFKRAEVLKVHSGAAYCTDFDPLGRYIATGGADAMVALLDINELACVRTFARLDSPIRTLSFSHDGKYIASASEDTRIDISYVDTGEHIHTLDCRYPMNSIAWNPKSLLLAYAGDERTAFGVFGFQK